MLRTWLRSTRSALQMKHLRAGGSSVRILDFSDEKEVYRDEKQWRVFSDADFGGASQCKLRFDRSCLTFEGMISTDTSGTKMKNSGYCAIMSAPFDPPLDLREFDALRMRVRTYGRVFISNIKSEGALPDDMHQLYILSDDSSDGSNSGVETPDVGADDNVWRNVTLPFADYTLTWKGQIDSMQEQFEGGDVRSVGFLMAERSDGPFRIDVQWVEAVDLQRRAQSTRYLGFEPRV